jgi:hypothetical protein
MRVSSGGHAIAVEGSSSELTATPAPNQNSTTRQVDSDKELRSQSLFAAIEQFGDRQIPITEKVSVVVYGDSLLKELGVSRELCDDIARFIRKHEHLYSQVLSRAPSAEERTRLEGRGAYHRAQVGAQPCEIYVKGIGNRTSFAAKTGTPKGEFPGFPHATEGELFFDAVEVNDHPRILGSETVTWASMELVNAAVVFAGLARENGWRTLEEVAKAGCTVPLAVMRFDELTDYFTSAIEARGLQNKRGAKWQGNALGLGTVAMLVPSTQRIAIGSVGCDADGDSLARAADLQTATASGRTLRALINCGFVYSAASSHGQNLYAEGRYTHADSSDLASLAAYQGGEISGNRHVSADEQRKALVFAELEAPALLTPPYKPISPLTHEDVTKAQTSFWRAFLGPTVPSNVAEQLAMLIPYLRTQINLAVADWVIDSSDAGPWERDAVLRGHLFEQFDRYDVPAEHERKVVSNLSRYSQDKIITGQQTHAVAIRALVDFIRTGDAECLSQSPTVASAMALMNEIEKLSDEREKRSFRRLATALLSDHGEERRWAGLKPYPDLQKPIAHLRRGEIAQARHLLNFPRLL